jgi:hypothetical protein
VTTLPRKCPRCGTEGSVNRITQGYGTPEEYEFVYCTDCPYNSET